MCDKILGFPKIHFTMRQSPISVTNFQERIVFLDYLRVFAFASVLIGHKFYPDLVYLSLHPNLNAPVKLFIKAILPFCETGAAGVVVFFLISGYIITSNLNQKSCSHFLIKRFFRLYPLYWCAVFIQWVLLFKQGNQPSATTLLKQLSLLGDFWGAPYSLSGVEWTLRTEILFYLLMAALKTCGLTLQQLPIALFIALLSSQLASPFPTHTIFSFSYCTTFGPFLFLGAMFILVEMKIASRRLLCFYSSLIFALYFYNMSKYQLYWLQNPAALLGFLIFLVSWILRSKFKSGYTVIFLSELTYAIYLFHNWLFDYFYQFLGKFGVYFIQQKLGSLLLLLIFCFLASKIVEKPGVLLGKSLTKYFSTILVKSSSV